MTYGADAYGAAPYAGASASEPPLLPPTITSIASAVTSAILTWDAVADALGYKVRIDGGAETDLGNVLTHTFTGLDPNTEYLFEVMAYNDDTESLWSEISDITIDHYEVRVDGGPETEVTDLCEAFSGLDPNISYTLEVRACNATCCSDWVTIEGLTCPAVPVNLNASVITMSGITLCWDAPTGGADTYEVRINGGEAVAATSCYAFTDLEPETDYLLEVRACNEVCCSDWTALSVTTKADFSYSSCPCGQGWQLEACDLSTGRVRAVLRPTAIDMQTIGNQVSAGQLTFPIKDVRLRDIWPGLTSIYITYYGTPVGAFRTSKPHAEGGYVQVGLTSIESYLTRRMIREDLTYTGVQQTALAVSLVAQAIPDGIPLTGQALPSIVNRDRSYAAVDRPFIWSALEDLMNSDRGPDYTLLHTKTAGHWSTVMLFEDEAGRDSQLTLLGDVHLTNYSLDVDDIDLTNLADGEGADDLLVTTDITGSSPYPRFDANPQFSEVTSVTTLQEQTDGYVQIRQHPYAVPGCTIVGDYPAPDDLGLHDTATFRFSNGVATFDGPAKVTGITWRAQEGQPLMRDLTLQPTGSVIDTVLNQVPTDDCRDC